MFKCRDFRHPSGLSTNLGSRRSSYRRSLQSRSTGHRQARKCRDRDISEIAALYYKKALGLSQADSGVAQCNPCVSRGPRALMTKMVTFLDSLLSAAFDEQGCPYLTLAETRCLLARLKSARE